MIDFIDDQLVGNYPCHAFRAWFYYEYMRG